MGRAIGEVDDSSAVSVHVDVCSFQRLCYCLYSGQERQERYEAAHPEDQCVQALLHRVLSG